MKITPLFRILAAWLLLSPLGCATTNQGHSSIWTTWTIENDDNADWQTAVSALAQGDLNKAEEALTRLNADAQNATPAARALYAEIPALRGDNKQAMTRYIDALKLGNFGDFEPIAYARLYAISRQTVSTIPWNEIRDLLPKDPYARARLLPLQARALAQANIHAENAMSNALSLTKFRWIGPFSPYPYSGFDDAYPFDGDKTLKSSYEIDGKTLDAFSYAPEIQTAMYAAKNGVYAGETQFDILTPGDYLLVVHSNQYYDVSVNTQSVLKHGIDDTGKYPVNASKLTLDKGTYDLRVKLGLYASENGQSPIHIWLTPLDKIDEKNSGTQPQNSPFPILERDEPISHVYAENIEENAPRIPFKQIDIHYIIDSVNDMQINQPFMAWFGAALAIADADAQIAEKILEKRLKTQPDDRFAQFWLAARYDVDADLASSVRHEKSMHYRRQLASSTPQFTAVQARMIDEMITQNQPKEALALWNEFRLALPQNADIALLESRVAKAVDWIDLAEDKLKNAEILEPNSCALLYRALSANETHHNYTSFDSLTAEQQSCANVIRAYARREGNANANDPYRWQNALENLALQFPNDPNLKLEIFRNRAQAQNPLYNSNSENKATTTNQDLSHTVVAPLLDLLNDVQKGILQNIDLNLALNIVDELKSQKKYENDANRILQKLLEIAPTEETLQNLNWQIQNTTPLQNLRKDGIQIVKNYLEQQKQTPSPEAGTSLVLLDYAAVQFFPNGAKLGLTHTISRVLSKEGKNAVGEVYIPNTASVLKVRTIKADSLETIEPESIDFKSSITAPNLAIGDFVETEYLTFEPPLSAYSDKAISDSFFYASAQTPILHSEFLLRYPSQWHVDIVESGPQNTLQKQCAQEENWTQCTYFRDDIPFFVTEPNAPSEFDILPNIQLYHRWGWDDIRRALRESTSRQTRITPYVQTYFQQIKFDESNTSSWKRAQTIYNFVLNSIRESDSTHSTDEESATQTLTRGVGSRLITLKALYDYAGLNSTFAFVRSVTAPLNSENLPAQYDSAYATLLVVDTDKGPAYVDASEDFIPFDYLPTAFQGQTVIPFDDAWQTFTSRNDAIDEMLPNIDIDYEIQPDGAASAMATETMRGSRALNMRGFLTSLKGDDERTHLIIQNSLARNYGRVELTNLELQNLDNHDAPLTLQYDFDIASFADARQNALDVNSSIFAYKLVDQFAKLPASSRKYPVIVNSDVLSKRRLNLKAPNGYHWNHETLNDVDIKSKFGHFSRKLQIQNESLQIIEEISLLPQRIELRDYADFRDFCLAVDEAQKTLLSAIQN